MDKEQFINICKSKDYSHKDIDKFEKAINLAEQELKSKKRLSGDTFFDHNIRVGLILVENKSMPEVVIAGLLHGLGSDINKGMIEDQFGTETLSLIEGVEEVKTIKHKNIQLEAEALRRILFTTLKDVRVILIKLASKLDNLKSIEVHPKTEQERIAKEVLEFYAPLAYRLGVDRIKAKLEDLAFEIIHPRKYNEISNFLEETSEQREKEIAEAIRLIKKIAVGNVKIIKIGGRPKHIYSIYRKIVRKKVGLKSLNPSPEG